jgi:hypothetical protein
MSFKGSVVEPGRFYDVDGVLGSIVWSHHVEHSEMVMGVQWCWMKGDPTSEGLHLEKGGDGA